MADKHGATIHQIALSWLLNHSPNILLIPGTSSVEHLEENMKTGDLVLDTEDTNELDGISPPVG